MNFNAIEYFLILEQERNFTRAAERLFISQQTLSSCISTLEKELGAPLFKRTSPLQLTYLGQTFLPHARVLSLGKRQMDNELNDITQNQRGELRVAATYSYSNFIIPEIVQAFHRLYPNIVVVVDEFSAVRDDALAEGLVDLVIASPVMQNRHSSYKYTEFFQEEFVIIARNSLLAEHGIDREAAAERIRCDDVTPLKDCPVISVLAEKHSKDIIDSLFRQNNLAPRVVARERSMISQVMMCYRGIGICLVPLTMAYSQLHLARRDDVTVFHLSPRFSRPLCFVQLRDKKEWEIEQAFIDISRRVFAETEKKIKAWQ